MATSTSPGPSLLELPRASSAVSPSQPARALTETTELFSSPEESSSSSSSDDDVDERMHGHSSHHPDDEVGVKGPALPSDPSPGPAPSHRWAGGHGTPQRAATTTTTEASVAAVEDGLRWVNLTQPSFKVQLNLPPPRELLQGARRHSTAQQRHHQEQLSYLEQLVEVRREARTYCRGVTCTAINAGYQGK